MGRDGCGTFSENVDVAPAYCSGVASVLVDHGNLHFAFYQEHIAGDGSKERVIIARIILSMEAFLNVRATVDFEIACDLALCGQGVTALAS